MAVDEEVAATVVRVTNSLDGAVTDRRRRRSVSRCSKVMAMFAEDIDCFLKRSYRNIEDSARNAAVRV